MTTTPRPTPTPTPSSALGPAASDRARQVAAWLIDRDVDAVAQHLDGWILAAEPDHHPAATAIPLLGTPEWVAADDTTRNAAVAIYVLGCLAEREPVVIAARLAAEIAAGRTAYLLAMRQASHAISAEISARRNAKQGPNPASRRRTS